MQTNANKLTGILAEDKKSKQGVEYTLKVEVEKLPTDAEFQRLQAILAFQTGTHRNGDSALWDSELVDTKTYIRGIRASGTANKGYRISSDDKAEGKSLFDQVKKLGGEAQWSKVKGVEFSLDACVKDCFSRRVALAEKAKADAENAAAAQRLELERMLGKAE